MAPKKVWDWAAELVGISSLPAGSVAEGRARLGMRRLSGWLLIGLALGLACAYREWSERPIVAVLWCLAFYASSFLIGFLFGIPRVLQNGSGSRAETSPGSESANAMPAQLGINTNLEQVSDWLVKILIGLGLTELNQIPGHIYRAAQYIAPSLYVPRARALFTGQVNSAAALVVYFSVLGFLTGYLITRLLLGGLFRAADYRTISPGEEAEIKAGAEPPLQLDLAPEMKLEPKAAVAAGKIERLSLDNALGQGIQAEALALAKLNAGRYDEALAAYRRAIQISEDDPRLRLNFAYVLRKTGAPISESVEQLAIARSMLMTRTDSPELKRQVYRALTFFALYLAPPESFRQATFYATEYMADAKNPRSPDVTLNLACAHGQEATAIRASGGDISKTRTAALEALKLTLALDSAWKERISELMHPNAEQQRAGESDLAVFAGDAEFEQLLGP